MTEPTFEDSSIVAAASVAITLLYTYGIMTGGERDKARKRLASAEEKLTGELVRGAYKFDDGEIHLCWACGALPCDGGLQSWEKLPWIVTLKNSAGQRFLIDRRDPENADMFGGLLITGDGRVFRSSLTTGETGRRKFHRSHFEEDLPA